MWDAELNQVFNIPEKGLLLICVGNSLRGDDGVGPYIAGALSEEMEGLTVYDAGMNPENCLAVCDQIQPGKVVFIDAANWEGTPGDIRLIPEELIPLQTISTHTFPLSTLGALIKEDQSVEVKYIGIQLASAHLGDAMCEAVRTAAHELIRIIQHMQKQVTCSTKEN